jgi:ABC-type oligopeptide transport system substrate-binding subunit/class 3 adenylate cyclase/tetratricopeptide (TPR) repeat protein
MRCPKCNKENPEDATFCMKCGAKLTLACAQCGTELPLDPDARFCLKCGSQLTAPPAATAAAPPDAIVERLQRLVPREYAERLLATRGQVQPERRTVTILFSDVKGSTAMAEDLDPEDVLEIMSGAFDVLIEPIYRYEGTLARLMGDAVLAFFGAPIAHEDDPERACRAGLEIIAEAAEYAEKLEKERGIKGFNVRVGINTGLVVVGEVGSDLRVEYTAMGDAINLAARMEQSAPPGGILITHDTYRHVRGVFDVLAQEPLSVKGKREPMQTYLVQQAKPRAFRKPMRGVEGIETRMIGREAQLDLLQEAFFTAMEDRELQMATIVGDAGVGKSRLLHEFDIWAEALAEQYYFFKGRALQEMQGLPYALIGNLFAFRFQIEDTDPLPVVCEKLEQGVHAAMGDGEESQLRAHFIGHLLGFELGPSPHLEDVLDDPKQLRDRALTYLVDYFKALAAELPVLVLLEDLHWADDSSLDVLNHLALALIDQPVMIVGAARPALFERRPHWGEGQAFHRRLQLEPLTKRNTRRLLDEILQKVDHVPDTLSDLVVAGAEGNPFFVEELIKMLVEDGVIVKGEEQWRVEPERLTEVRVPSTLRGVLQARLDRLPIQDRSILQQASVVGRLFWDRVVVRISESASDGVEEAEVLNTLSALRGREMVFQRETSAIAGAQEYIFKHAVLREVTYESLLKRLRRVYHGLVADWLMEQGGERVGEYTGLIADHLELAGRTAEATDYLLEAGDRARGLYAHQEAIGTYQRALALLKEQGDDERAARTLMTLGLTYHGAFDYERAQQSYEEAFALWHRVSAQRPHAPLPPAPHALRVVSPLAATLDPALVGDVRTGAVVGELFRRLVEVTPELDVVPDMARSWDVLDGGRKYVFYLREDVRWSDGQPVTAHDFAYSWKRLLTMDVPPGNVEPLYHVQGAKAFHQGVTHNPDSVAVRALDDVTLVVELESPAAYFLQWLGDLAMCAVPRHAVDAHGSEWIERQHIVTNGPFRIESWHPGESIVLLRYADYTGRFSGNLERVQLLELEASDALQMYQADALDVLDIQYLSPVDLDRARQRHAAEYIRLPWLATQFVVFDVDQPPMDDERVRKAFVLSTDRRELANVARKGLESPATGGLVPPGMPGHSPGIALPYDPAAGRELLAQAGFPAGRGVPCLTATAPTFWTEYTEFLQGQWRENLGVDVSWALFSLEEYFGPDVPERYPSRVHMRMGAWIPDYPDPDSYLRVVPRSITNWRNETFDQLVEKAMRVMDHGERMRLYAQAERILVQEAPMLYLTYRSLHVLLKPWVKRYSYAPTGKVFWKDVIIEPH